MDKKIKLVNMVQVMLVRRILPGQRRAFNLWEFVPGVHQTLRELINCNIAGFLCPKLWMSCSPQGLGYDDYARLNLGNIIRVMETEKQT